MVGVSSWTKEDTELFILDADYLWKDSGVQATSVIFVLPRNAVPGSLGGTTGRIGDRSVVDHVPLLYLQSDQPYDMNALHGFVIARSQAADAAVGRDVPPVRIGSRTTAAIGAGDSEVAVEVSATPAQGHSWLTDDRISSLARSVPHKLSCFGWWTCEREDGEDQDVFGIHQCGSTRKPPWPSHEPSRWY